LRNFAKFLTPGGRVV